jgi:DNA repair protein SbcD/Mre11
MTEIRILLLADSHLGFDLPVRPRIARRRRGDDFLANYAAALAPALAGEADLVVHGGDVFHRARVHESVAYEALGRLVRVADQGVPVCVVPGNHERSLMPHSRFARHPRLHVFDRPRTFTAGVRGTTVALAGFPYQRDIRTRFVDLLEQTGWRASGAALSVLCLHHCVEGATVGPGDFTFTAAADVIRGRDLPQGLAAVLSGHIHRHQVLTRDLRGRPLAAPVLYPGSIERTSFAELDEVKGFMLVTLAPGAAARWEFRPLPARPMLVREVDAGRLRGRDLDEAVSRVIAAAPPDAVLRIRVSGDVAAADLRLFSATRLRAMAPGTMNVEVVTPDAPFRRRRTRAAAGAPRPDSRPAASDIELRLELQTVTRP